jgi:type IV secretion system protein VirB10
VQLPPDGGSSIGAVVGSPTDAPEWRAHDRGEPSTLHERGNRWSFANSSTGSNTDIIQALRLSAANSLNQAGQQVVRRNLNIQPTLTIRPGFPVRVIVNRDLVLEPYRG